MMHSMNTANLIKKKSSGNNVKAARYEGQVQQLAEVFPTWSRDDLIEVLNETGGDVYLAISRISEGHVNQWSDSRKPDSLEAAYTSTSFSKNKIAPSKSSSSKEGSRVVSSNKKVLEKPKEPSSRGRNDLNSSEKKKEPSGKDAKMSIKSPSIPLTLLSVAPPASSSESGKKSFADAASASLIQKEVKKAPAHKLAEVCLKKDEKVQALNADGREEVVKAEAIDVVEDVRIENPVKAVFEQAKPVPAVIQESSKVAEDFDFVVQMPCRAPPSLTMEQPAVVLPLRTCVRSNVSVRFGFEEQEEPVAVFVPVNAIPATPNPEPVMVSSPSPVLKSQKTPISVAALESAFALPSASSDLRVQANKSPYVPATTASVSSSNTSGSSLFTEPNNFAKPSAVSASSRAWDYEPATSAAASASFGPAPGFTSGGGDSQRYSNNNRFNNSTSMNVQNDSSNYEYHDESIASESTSAPFASRDNGNNNVSRYYTTRSSASAVSTNQQTTGTYAPSYHRSSHTQGNSALGSSNRYASSSFSNPQAAPVSGRHSSNNYYHGSPVLEASHQASYHHNTAHGGNQYQSHYQHQSQQQQSMQQAQQYSYYTNPYQQYSAYPQGYHVQEPQVSSVHAGNSTAANPTHLPHYYSSHPAQPYYQPYQPPHQYLNNNASANRRDHSMS